MSLPSAVDRIWHGCKNQHWGAWALVMLLVSVSSGIIVGLQYDYSTPWYSTTAIDLVVPYGRFFRSLHFYSSQLFFFFSIFHFLAVYSSVNKISRGQWLLLTGSLPLILLLVFTGYVLRADTTGTSAGRIAENLLLAVPFIGETLNSLFFSLHANGLRKVYLHHIISFDLLLLLFLWRHLHRYRVEFSKYPALISAICAFSMLVSAPLEPEQPGVYISGPWFFLGLQEMLRYLPPFTAGILIPVIFIVALLLAHPEQKRRKLFTGFCCGWLAGYTVLSVIAFCRS